MGWRKGGNWLSVDDLTYNTNAKEGHLPARPGCGHGDMRTFLYKCQRGAPPDPARVVEVRILGAGIGHGHGWERNSDTEDFDAYTDEDTDAYETFLYLQREFGVGSEEGGYD